MKDRIEVRTIAEFNACIKAENIALVFGIRVEAPPGSTVEAWENSTVTARGNSTVTAWENSTVEARGNSIVEARENSTVTARGNSTVTARGNSTVTAWGNSTVTAWENSTVTAWENSTVTAWENSTVTAWGNVFVRLFKALAVIASAHVVVMLHGSADKLEGGIHVQAMNPTIGSEWCEYFGIDPATSPFRVPDLDAKILAAVEADKLQFDMGSWHGNPKADETNWCETTHCRAGAAICIVGKAAFDLEKKLGDPEVVGQMIYAASRLDKALPDFHGDTEGALESIRNDAAESAKASAT